MGWSVVVSVLGGGLALVLWGVARARRTRPLDEALPECPIAELEPGRFRLVGRVVPIETSPSAIDELPCVYRESAEYRTVGTGIVPLLREVEHEARCHPFYLEDDSGRILVDPARALIECATVTADGGLAAERRLRAGEVVSLEGTFAPCDDDPDGPEGPYRGSARRWRPIADASGPPRLSHRTEAAMVAPPPDDLTGFLGGVGGMMLLMGAFLAFVVGMVA